MFLSYASQDAEAAKRICEALRAAGVEVWFDQSELVGGDAWDAKIRKQIKECALLIPIISAATQARTEGYFRLEWRLADQRTHLMAKGRPFLLPVVIDDTRDADAHVPDSFTEVQWTRLPGGETSTAFAARVKKLLAGEAGPVSDRRSGSAMAADSVHGLALVRKRSLWPWLIPVVVVLAVIVGAAVIVALRMSPKEAADWVALAKSIDRTKENPRPPAPSPSNGLSEARQLVLKARKLFEAPEVTNRENFLLAGRLCDKAIEVDPADAEVWAARAQLSYLMISYGHDRTPARLESLVSDAERALALAPNSYEARLATAFALARQPSRRVEAEKSYRSLLQENPADKRVLLNLGHLLRWDGGRNDEAFQLYDQAAALPGGDPIALADKANAYYFLDRLPEAEKAVEQSLAQAPTGRAYLMHALLQMILREDTGRAVELLKHVPAATLHDNRGVNIAFRVWLWRREPEQALQFLREVPQDYIEDIYFTGPKAVLTGWAQQLAGHQEAARADWESALGMLDRRGQDQSTGVKAVRCELLARLGRKEEASRLFAEIGQTEGADWPRSGTSALNLLVVLGRNDEALALLPALIDQPGPAPLTRPELRLNPLYDPLRGDPRFQALIAEPKPASGGAVAVPSLDTKSVAVLAFTNLSDDKGNEYFSDGISEELLNVLAKVPGLKVSARTSAFYFKGKEVPIPEIAQKLGVAYVVEGSVQKAGNRVRITAQLIKAADGFQVWSDQFDRELKDIFAVQDEIAGLIADNLKLKMGDIPRVTRTVNPEAHRLVLEGRHFWNLRTTEGFTRAEKAFTEAIELDPQFAEAHAGLADNFQIRAQYKMLDGVGGEAVDQERAWTEGQTAFRLDPSLPETNAALAYLLHNQGKLAEAEGYYEKTFALNPNYAIAHLWHGQWLDAYGRLDAAIEENRLACELDPLGFIILDRYAQHLALARRFDEALAMNERAAALRTDLWMPNVGERALILFALGRNKEAVETARLVRQNPASWPRWTADADALWVLGQSGRSEEAGAYTAELLQTLPEKSYVRGFVLLNAGRFDEAMPYLERSPVLMRRPLFWDQSLDRWREDPQFQKLLAKLGCAEEYKVARDTLARMLKEQEARK